MPASKGVRLVEGPDANATLYKASKIVDVALERIDKLETRQRWTPCGNKGPWILTPVTPDDAEASGPGSPKRSINDIDKSAF